MQSMMDDLGDIIRKQQQLRDNTHRQGQGQGQGQGQDQDQRQGQRGQQGQQRQGQQRQDQQRQGQRGQQGQRPRGGQQGRQDGDPSDFSELRERQQALRDQLKKLEEELRKHGLGQAQKGQDGKDGQQGQGGDPGRDTGNALGDADSAMGDAAEALSEGNSDNATDSQGRAIEALRRGAQGLAQEMQQQGQQQGQGGPYGPPGRMGSRAERNTDPLGRPLRGRDYGDDTTVKVPGEIDTQRARRIIEELRKRFGESSRPQLELDYIERLLKDY